MLSADRRMRSSSDFAAVIQGGKRQATSTVVVHALDCPNTSQADLSKVGFVVSKRVGNSVVRHRVARQLRHIIREFLPFTHPSLVVVRAQPAAASASFDAMTADMQRALTKLQIVDVGRGHEGCAVAPAIATSLGVA